MQTIDPARKVITLPDQPSDKDAFGAHREIAAAIAQMISTENGGVTIGLEGTWGSGKSTVVKLLTEHLNQRQCCVFSYDSWAHEGDPLRRSFLESLGEHLASEKWRWLDASYWKEERERLAGRRSKTKTKIRQHVTRNGRWLIAVVLATPIGMSIFNLGVSQADTDTPFRARLFNLAVGGLIAGGPLWMALGLFVRRVWRKLFKSDQPRAGAESPKDHTNSDEDQDDADDEFWAVLNQTGNLEQSSDSFQTSDPTSLEFRETFNKLVSKALAADPNRRLIVVLDNLDRVDARRAQDILATMQVFFGSDQRLAERDRLWTILPYDREGLTGIWNDLDQLEEFLGKIHEVRFYLSPLVLSDWRRYLTDKIAEAFPSENREAVEAAVHVFALARLDYSQAKDQDDIDQNEVETPASGGGKRALRRPPTPRSLIRFANQMGAVARVRPNDEPLTVIAYYAFLREAHVNIEEELLAGAIPSSRVGRYLGANVASAIADIYYGVRDGRGMQLLLGEPIRQVLAAGDPGELREIAGRDPGAFWAVLDTLDLSSLMDDGASDFARGLTTLSEAGLLANATSTVRARLRRDIADVEYWRLDGVDVGRGLARTIQELSIQEDEVKSIFSGAAGPPDETLPEGGKPRIEALVTLLAELRDSYPGLLTRDETWQGFVLPGTAEEYMEACQHLRSIDPNGYYWHLIGPANAQEIVSHIAGLMRSGEPLANEVLELISRQPAVDWEQVRGLAAETIRDESASPQDIENALDLFTMHDPEGDALDVLANTGHLLHHLHNAHTSNNAKLAARLAYHHLRHVPKIPAPTESVGRSQAGAQILKQMFGEMVQAQELELAQELRQLVLERDSDLPFRINKGKVGEAGPWLYETIRQMADRGLITSNRLVGSWPRIKIALSPDKVNEIVAQLIVDGSDLISRALRKDGYDGHELLARSIINNGFSKGRSAPEFSAFVSSVRDWLVSFDGDRWAAKLETGDEAIELVLDMRDRRRGPRLKTPFREALIRFGERLAAGTLDREFGEHWSSLPKLLENKLQREQLAEGLLGKIAVLESIDQRFWKIFGQFLSDQPIVHSRSSVLASIAPKALRNRDLATQQWLADTLDSHPNMLEGKDRADAVKALKEQIAEELRSPEPPAETIRLAEVLGVAIEADESS